VNCEVDFSERSSRAHHNGESCEEQIKRLLPEAEYGAEEVDCIFFGDPLEIKSCQLRVQANTQKGSNTISGRFYLRDYQHNYLVENGGRYILVVMDGDLIVHTRMVLAEKLLPEFSGCRTLTWTTVFHFLGVAC